MKKYLLVLLVCLGTSAGLLAQNQINFSEHIAPIIYDNCTSCHRPGEIGPQSFTSYQEVKDWASTIAYVTDIKYMPPWQPNLEYSHFVGERSLTEREIQLITDWVDGGAPQGDPAKEPPLPYFPTGSQLGEPDLVLTMEEAYTIKGNNKDDYRVFVLPTNLTQDKEVAAVEFRPGNGKAVHHALMAYDTRKRARARDAEDEEYGYFSFGDYGIEGRPDGTFIGYTPGIQTVRYPFGIGKMLPANADLLIQVHYAPLPTDESDRSTVNVFFKKGTDKVERPIQQSGFTPFDIDIASGGALNFFLPANEIKEIKGVKKIDKDISLVSVYPHCHYLGKSWEIFAVTPELDTINIIQIKEWDFNWQGAYTFDKLLKIPAGSTVYANAVYDNTVDNPFNPSNPPVRSTWGEGTTDEMYLVGINFVDYQEGDEDLVVGEQVLTSVDNHLEKTNNVLYPPFPNPAQETIVFNYYLDQQQAINLGIYDMAGKLVKTILTNSVRSAGNHKLAIEVNDLSGGAYLLNMSGTTFALSENLIIVE